MQAQSRGVGSRAIESNDFKVITWNARALLRDRPGVRDKKLAILKKLADTADVLLTQETHENRSSTNKHLRFLEKFFLR